MSSSKKSQPIVVEDHLSRSDVPSLEDARLMLMAMPDLTFRFDRQGHYLGYVKGLGEDLYAAPERFLGHRLDEVLPAQPGKRLREAIEEALRSQQMQIVEYMLPIDGHLTWFEARFVPMVNDQVLAVVRNVHEAHQVRMRLQESEARFRALVSNVPGAIYRMRVDAHWTTSFISDAIEDIAGYPASDFWENAVRSFASVIHPEDRARVAREVQEAVDKGTAFDLEYRVLHRSGALRWVSDRGQAVPVEDSTEAFVEGVILDMTEWRNVQ
jgi:PAS domain S-box-containing protein